MHIVVYRAHRQAPPKVAPAAKSNDRSLIEKIPSKCFHRREHVELYTVDYGTPFGGHRNLFSVNVVDEDDGPVVDENSPSIGLVYDERSPTLRSNTTAYVYRNCEKFVSKRYYDTYNTDEQLITVDKPEETRTDGGEATASRVDSSRTPYQDCGIPTSNSPSHHEYDGARRADTSNGTYVWRVYLEFRVPFRFPKFATSLYTNDASRTSLPFPILRHTYVHRFGHTFQWTMIIVCERVCSTCP